MSDRVAHLSLASGRYAVYGEIASGGMATIHYGRLVGPSGFSRAVAIKQLHPQFAKDQNFVSMFLDEARLSARIAHANVVQTIDVLSEPSELSVIMEYVHGESLARLLDRLRERRETTPVRIAVALVAGVLHGLHAAHETRGEHGEPLHIVHRDVSPENILVASDGIARLIDFGIARAQGRSRVTPAGELKGKLAYMACEQYRGGEIDRRVDVYGAAVVLWEALTGRPLFEGETDAGIVGAVMSDEVIPPSVLVPAITPALDAIVMRGLSRERDQRFDTAREMALALERQVGLGTQSEVSDWLELVAGDLLHARAEALRELCVRAAAAQAPVEELTGTRRIEARSLPPDAKLRANIEAGSVASPAQDTRKSELRRGPNAGRIRKLWPFAVAAVLGALTGGWLLASDKPSRDGAVTGPREADRMDTRGERAGPPMLPQPSMPAPAAEAAAPVMPQTPVLAPPPAFDTKRSVRDTSARGSTGDVPATPPTTPSEPARATKVSRTKTRARAPKKPVIDCREPFVTDARGIRHVRRECLD